MAAHPRQVFNRDQLLENVWASPTMWTPAR
ncbi:MAG: hypothetical protein R3C44_23440 [Chloroflexota bacterium]